MPKVKFTFNRPEEEEEYQIYSNAMNMHIFINEFGEFLRRRYKHTEPKNDDVYAEFEAIRDKFYALKEENEVVG